MTTAFATLPPSVEEAAAMLGAPPLTVFRRVTLLLAPGFVASAALSFLISFDEVVISLFITGPRLKTLPVEILTTWRAGRIRMTAAVSVMLIVATLCIVFLIERTLGLSRTLGK